MSLFRKVAVFARSPQGRALIAQAQQRAKDPATRAKLEQLRKRGQKPR